MSALNTDSIKMYNVFKMIPKILVNEPQAFIDYTHLTLKIIRICYFGHKIPIYGSADITNACNLKCRHCYWWKNWKPSNELTPGQWRTIIREKFKKARIFRVALTGGEPLLRPEVIEIFNEELQNKVIAVTNGTLPLIDFSGVKYYVSVDGTEKIHDMIRGTNVHKKVKKNVKDYEGNIVVNMTINTINCDYIAGVVKEWNKRATAINFQFHTPYTLNDKLWVPFGKKRDEIIDRIIKLKEEYPDFFINTDKQLNLFRSNAWTKECPNWSVISLDNLGQRKNPCCMGGTIQPLCERCGMCETTGLYAGLYQKDVEWFKVYDILKKC